MSRPSLPIAVVALLAVLSATAAGGVVLVSSNATTPVVPTAPGEPNHLTINASEVGASNTTAVNLDVGASITADSASLRADFIETSFQRAIANARTEANRTEIRLRTLQRLENASERLRERNKQTIAAYATGDRASGSFLQTRARITTRAEELHGIISTISDSLPFQPQEDVVDRVNYQRGQLRAMQGPISTEAANAIIGGGDRPIFYAEASDSGYTLARIADGTYHRETFLGSQWRPDVADQFATDPDGALDAVRNRSAAIYPWVVENKDAGGGVFGGGIYWRSWEIPGGMLRIYLDGGTTNVFREFQARALPSFNTTELSNRTVEDVRISVDRTYATGPAAVTLHDAASGEAINGTVVIGSRDPVPVGDDGRFWFVQPRHPVRINATAGATDLSVTLSDSVPATTPQPRATPGSEG